MLVAMRLWLSATAFGVLEVPEVKMSRHKSSS